MEVDVYTADSELCLEIQKEIEKHTDNYLYKTLPLNPEDFQVIGNFIQAFNYADLNCRRLVDIIKRLDKGEDHQNGGILQDGQLYDYLLNLLKTTHEDSIDTNKITNIVTRFKTHHNIRHSFAHWAARRIPNREALYMMTYKASEGEKRTGTRTRPREITYMILPLSSVKIQLDIMNVNSTILAHEVARLEMHSEIL